MVHDDWRICVLSPLLVVEVSNDPAHLMRMGDNWSMCQIRMISIDLCMPTIDYWPVYDDYGIIPPIH